MGMKLRDIILILGGIFLIFKSTREIHDYIENKHHDKPLRQGTFYNIIFQILLLILPHAFLNCNLIAMEIDQKILNQLQNY